MRVRRKHVRSAKAHYALLLTKARERLEITQSQCAKMCGLTRQGVDKYERGAMDPSLQTMLQIVCGLGLESIAELVSFDRAGIKQLIADGPPCPRVEDPEIKAAVAGVPA